MCVKVCANANYHNNNNNNNNITYLIRVNPSANAVIKGCPEQLKIELK